MQKIILIYDLLDRSAHSVQSFNTAATPKASSE